MLPILGGVGPEQLELATPCTEWSVLALINHNLAVQRFVDDMLSGVTPTMPSEINLAAPVPEEGPEAALRTITGSIFSKLKSMDLEEIVDSPFGPMGAGNFVMFPMADLYIHKWDLAKATGQDATLDSELADMFIQIVAQSAEAGRASGAFGPEVMVPDGASGQERLLGMSGRQP